MQVDRLNPFSSKGRLSFAPFFGTVVVTVFINIFVYLIMRSKLIPARAALDKERTILLYAVWIVFSIVGFSVISNTFIKRWSAILGSEPGRLLRGLIRFSLLSPLLSYPLTFLTLLFFPASPIADVESGGSRPATVLVLVLTLTFGIGAASFLPSAWFGLDRLEFRESVEPYAAMGFQNGKNPLPTSKQVKPLLSAATPGGRYLFWLAMDFVRARALQQSVDRDEVKTCAQRLGFMRTEVQDCYFSNFRKMGTVAPFVTPYFGFYFEGAYRKSVLDEAAKDAKQTPMQGFAANMVMISNLVELIEPGPMFVERTHFLKPEFLLHAYGSPEVPLVEAGQDFQRVNLLERILPMFDEQIKALNTMIDQIGSVMGPDEVTVRAEIRELENRVAAIKRDPLMLGKH